MASQPPIRISLVVTTLGRVREMDALLRTMAAQTLPPFEVIVVDQSATPQTRECLNRFQSTLPRIIHLPSPRCGVSRGRNTGLRCASGDIVGFPDDDCELPPDLLERIAATFSKQPSLDALVMSTRAVDGGPGMTRTDATAGPIDMRNLLRRCVDFGIVGRREILQRCEFDETIGTGAGTPWGADEGPDLLARLMMRGAHLQYFPELVIFHPYKAESGTLRSVFRRSIAYGRGRGRLLRSYSFPKAVVASNVLRPAAGAIVSLLRLRVRRALYRIGFSLGVIAGLLSGRNHSVEALRRKESRSLDVQVAGG